MILPLSSDSSGQPGEERSGWYEQGHGGSHQVTKILCQNTIPGYYAKILSTIVPLKSNLAITSTLPLAVPLHSFLLLKGFLHSAVRTSAYLLGPPFP
jgi:hypothetical protein